MSSTKSKKKVEVEPKRKSVHWVSRILGMVGLAFIVEGLSLMEFNYWICVVAMWIGFIAVLIEVIYDEWIEGQLWVQVACVGACFIIRQTTILGT